MSKKKEAHPLMCHQSVSSVSRTIEGIDCATALVLEMGMGFFAENKGFGMKQRPLSPISVHFFFQAKDFFSSQLTIAGKTPADPVASHHPTFNHNCCSNGRLWHLPF
jgi:hypothetical protein